MRLWGRIWGGAEGAGLFLVEVATHGVTHGVTHGAWIKVPCSLVGGLGGRLAIVARQGVPAVVVAWWLMLVLGG